ncbi:NAD-dependent epimerase/dehydratase family protein [Pedobacter mendelii]|uniref:NAD-dependent dehydratase n=1 Tax=Pedobacter mendelii TaxID=1908240 RepID=A0ABQ2BJK5_9SPHI|nr:NAD(P)-dependent oxidoreductase [Pedobacter mendelii]GGI25820.1 NAD-dependent dehydratase [Pedobacter mendelii]
MRKRVLITGATGFIGYHIIQAALANNLEVYVSVRKKSIVAHLAAFDIRYVELNFDSIVQMKANIEENKYNYIIHAAATTKAKNREAYFHINAIYTRNLAIAASSATSKLEKFVFVSSLAARGPFSGLHDSANLSNPLTNYGRSKALAETYLSQIKDLPVIVFRPTAVYGPREKDIFILIKGINAGFEFYIGEQEQKLSFIHVTDLADIIVRALSSNLSHKTYQISDGNVYNSFSLAEYVRMGLGKKTLIIKVPLSIIRVIAWALEHSYKVFNQMPALNIDKIKELTASSWACSIDSLQQDLGFEPKYQLESGLSETIAWYRENKWL